MPPAPYRAVPLGPLAEGLRARPIGWPVYLANRIGAIIVRRSWRRAYRG